MQVAGRPSWRFEESAGGDLYLALFVRDAARLEVAPAPEIPPPLSVAIDRPLAPASPAAAAQWAGWWRGLIEFQRGEAVPSLRLGPGDDLDAWLVAMAERHGAAFDPPEFESLASVPELRAVACAAFAADGRPLMPGGPPDRSPPGAFDYLVVRAAAEGAIAEFEADPGDIDGIVHVLDVRGAWSYLAAPGYALCSAQLAEDPAAAAPLLRAVFASRLGRT
jgi:hypothetical protein